MPARTGRQCIEGLRQHPKEVWIGGERVDDVTSHPAFRNGVRSLASLYDMQYQPDLKDTMTFPSPDTGDPVGISFIIPRTREEVERRTRMMTRTKGGMMEWSIYRNNCIGKYMTIIHLPPYYRSQEHQRQLINVSKESARAIELFCA